MLRFVMYLMCGLLIWMMMMTVLLIRTPCVFRIVPIYTFLNTVSAAPASFLSKANLRLAFASAVLMYVFQVCRLFKVIPRYVALSVCCNSVSSNIIFMVLIWLIR